MGFLDRVRSAFAPWDGTTGRPPSGNGASSFHLGWSAPAGPWVSAEVTLEVLEPPTVNKLYFWAMQVSFTDQGRQGGAGHIGLQWHFDHPGKTAVNWGGYGPDGRELAGSRSALPSTVGNVNTRDYRWHAARPYRLRVSRSDEAGPDGKQGWRGEVVDLSTGAATHIRDLWAQGTALADPMVWSEVFADCDEPSTTVRWSDFHLVDAVGAVASADRLSVNYQTLSDGGCTTTSSSVDERGWVQATNTERTTRQGTVLALRA
ncbi:MAG: hypothetical protein HYX32_06655 [Actinobacteria bacterium]|nr:hypothetical protein [Actinomycetota bacterium]